MRGRVLREIPVLFISMKILQLMSEDSRDTRIRGVTKKNIEKDFLTIIGHWSIEFNHGRKRLGKLAETAWADPKKVGSVAGRRCDDNLPVGAGAAEHPAAYASGSGSPGTPDERRRKKWVV
jgi:hypothetical protein